ncbi:MAG: endonuclease/exonuclease/phosphatase family protein [Gemmatimonadota bacterium]
MGRAGTALVAALALACAGATERSIPSTLRILVYNIHAGKDAAGRENLERVARLVREQDVDVALFQEVDRGTERSGGVDQPAELAHLTGFHVAFGKTLDYQGGEYGLAVLSRWPIEADTLHPLPVHPPQERAGGSREPRGGLAVRIRSPWGPVLVIDTHLDPSAEDTWRLQEVARLRKIAGRAAAGAPVLIGGDLNAEPESAVVTELNAARWRDAWAHCGSGPGLTYPAGEPVKRIDYLLLPDGMSCRSADVLATDPSDHRPVLFVLEPS